MEKKSFEKREKALLNKIGSRGGMFKYYRADLSRIASDQQYWLIVFTKPPRVKEVSKDKRVRWFVKFWVWDSHADTVMLDQVVENILHLRNCADTVLDDVSLYRVDFVHILPEKELVLVKLTFSDLGIYRFNGAVLQHPNFVKIVPRNSEFSTLYAFDRDDENMLVRAGDGQVYLYDMGSMESTDETFKRLTRTNVGSRFTLNKQIVDFQLSSKKKLLAIFASGGFTEFDTTGSTAAYLFAYKDRKKYTPNIVNEYEHIGGLLIPLYFSKETMPKPYFTIEADGKITLEMKDDEKGLAFCMTTTVPKELR